MSSPVEDDEKTSSYAGRIASSDLQAERIRLGLIQYVTDHPIDPDYAWISRNRPTVGNGRRSKVASMLAIAIFGLLVFVAASQTSRDAGTDAKDRSDLVSQIEARRDALAKRQGRLIAIKAENARLQNTLLSSGNAALADRVRRLGVLTGNVAVTGPGIVLVADDAVNADSDRETVLDKDLQRLVNGLWTAGAEAISINGQRLTNLSAIIQAGGAINANYIPLRPPYTVKAIGDPDTLPSRFAQTVGGATWFDLVQQVGLRLKITTSKQLTVPAAGQLVLRYAVPASSAGGTS